MARLSCGRPSRSCEEAGVELFAIGLESSLPEDMKEKVITREVLDQLTRSAGGEAFIVSEPKDLARICGTISDRMHNQYTFGYYPSRRQDQEWRSIRLEAKIPGLRVVSLQGGLLPCCRGDSTAVESEKILGWKQALGGTLRLRARSPCLPS